MTRSLAHVASRAAIDGCRFGAARWQRLHRPPSLDPAVRLYWWEGTSRLGDAVRLGVRRRNVFARNFGDLLSPLIVSLVSGLPVTHAVGRNKLIAIGSIFFGLKDHDTVWDAGLRRPRDITFALDAKRVIYAAVRGPRTWGLLTRHGIDCPPVFGDPVSLLPLYVSNDLQADVEIGFVPHWTHYTAVSRALSGTDVRVIDVLGGVNVVAQQILSCQAVFTTSLHGLIFAEAYGIPAMLLVTDDMRASGLLKFVDYYESTDREFCGRCVLDPANVRPLVAALPRIPTPRFRLGPLLESSPLPRATNRSPIPMLKWSTGASR